MDAGVDCTSLLDHVDGDLLNLADGAGHEHGLRVLHLPSPQEHSVRSGPAGGPSVTSLAAWMPESTVVFSSTSRTATPINPADGVDLEQ